MKIEFVDLKRQYATIKPEVDRAIQRVLRNANFILGPEVQRFEKEFARATGAKYAVGVGSGTDALYLSLWALGIGPGDEVITAPNSYVSSALVVYLLGAKPVFADVDPRTYNLDPAALRRAVTKRTRAIIPVHLYGQPADMAAITKIAREHKLHIVEDACQAHGASFKGRPVGTFGDFGCFSFYPGKNLGAYGDGGAIVTNDRKSYELLLMLRNYGQRQKYFHEIVGINSRLDAMQAAVLGAKLKHLRRWVELRRRAAGWYRKHLEGVSQISLPYEDPHAYHAYHIFSIRTPEREKLQKRLAEKGVSTVLHYPLSIHLQDAYRSWGYGKGDFPVAEKLSKELLSLPIFPEIREKEVAYVARTIKDFFAK